MLRSWLAGREKRRDTKFAEDHAWIDPAELDEAARTYEGGSDSLVPRPLGGTVGTFPRLRGRTKIRRGD